MTLLHRTHRALALALASGALLAGAAQPARALEEIQLRMPLLDTNFSIKLSELRDPDRLFAGTSDLAQLNQATNGTIGRTLVELLNSPLPLQTKAVVTESVGSPLLSQALLLVSALIGVDGVPINLTSMALESALQQASAKGNLTMLNVLQAMPGTTASIDLERGLFALKRLASQQQPADRLLAAQPAGTESPALSRPGPLTVQRRETILAVPYRPEPLRLVVISPTQGANGRLVLISHGLWDSPRSFEGWARHLASHGYTVLMPYHPGSDQSQQQAMLSGKVPPPGPAELRRRPMDITALIDGAAAGKLGLPPGLKTDSVVVLGQSWGATTALQLAGATPSAALLEKFCRDVMNPSRNLSWVLQCSFLSSADRAGLSDPRVKAVVAVSPPMSLLFSAGAAKAMNARVLLVSGSRDFVVPAGPEAIAPMAAEARALGGGHRLVLAKGGDHFNLGSPYAEAGGPLRRLILAWVNGTFAAGPAAVPGPAAPSLLPPDGWGDATIPLADVTAQLKGWSP
ncbi:alpha/beta hydrolase [Cyanobium sp. Morenito 9A2]|uniref:alpha/beta hydrolase n=1 Tax=Cyanobium sp. Morenito 9A2 TaxID=2823718 RepID=UPI0020CE052E|nr:alpha/beta hydrolase [Cyanobium sp. Morenito 9A2]MCP9850322.1 alpha/beta hydrolase [Cyanobium sp. Morenito 9A2]